MEADLPTCIPARGPCLVPGASHWGLVGGIKCLPCFALFLDWLMCILFQHISYWLPGVAEDEASIPIKVIGVKPDLGGLL